MHRLTTCYLIAIALPECSDPDDVSVTVKGFITADLPIELIGIIEKIDIDPSPSSDNKNLQDLLMLTAIRADKGKVVGYINRLENYDIAEIAKIATDHGLYEKGFTIFEEREHYASAFKVLVETIVLINRGLDWAQKVNRFEVWPCLAKAQLDGVRIKHSIGGQLSTRIWSKY